YYFVVLRRRAPHTQRAVRAAGVNRTRGWFALISVAVATAAAPWFVGEGVQRFVSECFLMLAMAEMWNLLAGYAGLVSMGQQVFVGIGAYCLFFASMALDVAPYWVLRIAPVVCAVLAAVIALFLFRLLSGAL